MWQHLILLAIRQYDGKSYRMLVGYRELIRLFGLMNGVLTYHISTLEKSRQIIVDRNNKTKVTRYYSKFLNMWTLTLYTG
jgi:DNA-binding MarR family transcriptional regulator